MTQQISRRYSHPFAATLETLPAQYPRWQLCAPQPCPPPPMDHSKLVYVDTFEGLQRLAEALGAVQEFAVDLEHSDRCAPPS